MNKHNPLEDRVVSSLVSMNRYDKQRRSFVKWLLWFAVLFMIVLVGLSALYLLKNQQYLSLLTVDLVHWPISRNERLLLLGGLSSAVVLTFCFAFIILNAISRLSRIIRRNFSAKIIDPIRKSFVGIGHGVTQSRVWQYFVKLGTELGYRYILYPALPHLEPTNDRKNITILTYEELPPEAYIDEHLCDETLERYNGSGNNIIMWALIAVLVGSMGLFFLWAMLLNTLAMTASKLPSSIAVPVSLFVTLTSLSSPFLFILYFYVFCASLFKPYRKRQAAWLLCFYQIQRKKELEDQALLINEEIGQRLRESVGKLVELYKQEFEKTQEATRKREDAISKLSHLGEQPGMDEQTLNSINWLVEFTIEQNNNKNEEQRKREASGELIKSNLIAGAVAFFISAFFFFLSIPAVCK